MFESFDPRNQNLLYISMCFLEHVNPICVEGALISLLLQGISGTTRYRKLKLKMPPSELS